MKREYRKQPNIRFGAAAIRLEATVRLPITLASFLENFQQLFQRFCRQLDMADPRRGVFGDYDRRWRLHWRALF